MCYANCQMGGQNQAQPDVCMTPAAPSPVPVSYPNISMLNTATPSQTKVQILATPAHNIGTTVPMSNGDNAGVNLNSVSGCVMGPTRHLKSSMKVKIVGQPATRQTDQTGQNGVSPGAMGSTMSPSQTKVKILS
jgi:hypothetical protein